MEPALDIKKKIVKNTIANALVRLSAWIISFLMLPFMISRLGTVGFGVWFLVNTIIGYFGILDLGITPAITKYIAEYHAKKDEKSSLEIINTAFVYYLAVGVISCVCTLLLADHIVNFLRISEADRHMAWSLIVLTAISLLFGPGIRVFRGVFHGLQRYDLMAGIDLVSSVVTALVIVVVLLSGFGVVEVVFYSIVFSGVGQLLAVAYARKIFPPLRLEAKYFSRARAGVLFLFGGTIFMIQISMMMIFELDLILVGTLLGVELVAFYAVAWKIHEGISQMTTVVTSALIPAASEMDAKNYRVSLETLFFRSTKYTLAVCLALATPALVLAPTIMEVWVGPEFVSYAIIAQILVIILFFSVNHRAAAMILLGTNRIRGILYYYVILAFCSPLLSVILAKPYGLTGIALGTAISYIVLEPVFMLYAFRTLGIRPRDYFSKVLFPTYSPAAVIGFALLGTMTLLPHLRTVFVVFAGFLAAGLYAVIFYRWGMKEQEKEDVHNTFREIYGLLRRRDRSTVSQEEMLDQ